MLLVAQCRILRCRRSNFKLNSVSIKPSTDVEAPTINFLGWGHFMFSLPKRRTAFCNCPRQLAKTDSRFSPSRAASTYFPWWVVNCRLADFYCGNITETDWEKSATSPFPGSNFIVAPSYRSPLQTVSDQYGSYMPGWVMWHSRAHTCVFAHMAHVCSRIPRNCPRYSWCRRLPLSAGKLAALRYWIATVQAERLHSKCVRSTCWRCDQLSGRASSRAPRTCLELNEFQ